MSGECDKCGEHSLECNCEPFSRHQENDPQSSEKDISPEQTAKFAYIEILQAIHDLEIKHNIWCDKPLFIQVNKEIFHRSQLEIE